MLRTLFYIPHEIAGVPVFGFGWLLAVWLVIGVVLLVWIGWRQGFGGETLSYVPLLVLVGAVIAWLLPALCKQQGLPIHGYGVMLLVALLSGTALAVRRARRVGIQPDLVYSLVFWMFVPGLVGARLFYVIEYWSSFERPTTRETLVGMINIADGGLVVYGSLVGGILGLVLFVRKNRLPLLAIGDLIAPSLMLGLALGRGGCLLNGCCFGSTCELPWAITFPQGGPANESPAYASQIARGQMHGMRIGVDTDTKRVVARQVDPESEAARAGLQEGDPLLWLNGEEVQSIEQVGFLLGCSFYEGRPVTIETGEGRRVEIPAAPIRPRSLPVHPTQIYSSINALLICLLLLAYDPFHRRDGELLAVMMTIYPITRFLLEIIRTDEATVFGTGLTISQNVSLLLLLAMAGLWYYILRQSRGTTFGATGRA